MRRAESRGPARLAVALLTWFAWASIPSAQDFPVEPAPSPRLAAALAGTAVGDGAAPDAVGAVAAATAPPGSTRAPPPRSPAAAAVAPDARDAAAAKPAGDGAPVPPLPDWAAHDERTTRIVPPAAAAAADTAAVLADGTLSILGETVPPGTRRELSWKIGESFDGGAVTTPVLLLRGVRPGPTLCLTAAIHGDELNGVEVVRRVANDVDPKQLDGTLIGVPIVNLLGFSRGSRYLPDRRDLNRFFPGTASGSAASRIAYKLFRELIVACDALVDFHTGSFDRTNLPQVRGDLTLPSVLEFTRGFGATPVLHSPGSRGMLRLAATDHGIPAVTFEVGAPLRLEPEKIDFAVQAISTLMHRMGMTRSYRLWAEPQATFYESKWVRVNSGGMLFSTVALGQRVRAGQRLGKVVDPLRNAEVEVKAPFPGRIIGMALNQLVLPGFAAFHIGIETTEAQAAEDAALPPESPDGIERLEGDQLRGDDGDEAPTESPLDAAARRGERGGDETNGAD